MEDENRNLIHNATMETHSTPADLQDERCGTSLLQPDLQGVASGGSSLSQGLLLEESGMEFVVDHSPLLGTC